MIRFQDLRNKEVINIKDGERLGFVCDAEFDIETGKILAIIVPGKRKCNLFKNNEHIILWQKIKKIGNDILLVDDNTLEVK